VVPVNATLPRRLKISRRVVLAGALAALALSACGGTASTTGGHHPAPSAQAAAAHAATPSPTASAYAACQRKESGPPASGDVYLRTIQPGAPPSTAEYGGEWVWNSTLGKCLTSVQMLIAVAPQVPGYCTQVGYVADNPGYDVNAAGNPPLKHLAAESGPAC
jgi:hypothetical protein